MYYASIGMLSLVIHIIINFAALKKRKRLESKNARDRYRHFLYAVMLYYAADILWGLFYEQKWIVLTYADTILFFMMMVLSVLLWTRFVVAFIENTGRFGKFLLSGGWIIVTFEIIALIINFFTPIVFGFGDNNEYQPGITRFITLVLQMILFLTTSIYTLFIAAKVHGEARAHHRTIGFSGVVMSLFILLQSQYPLMPFYSIGCLLATCMIHSFMYKDEMLESYIAAERAKRMAYRDALTGVRSKLAYLDTLKDLEVRIQDGSLTEYGVVVFDVNGLKEVNDTQGHDKGDDFIRSACRLICGNYDHSPVFRIGGDEFVAILEGNDYEERDTLLQDFERNVEENRKEGGVVVACGMSVYEPDRDTSYNDVFRRADRRMYDRKEKLKMHNGG